MTDQNSYFKIKFDDFEIEIEGSESFIEKQESSLKYIFSVLPISKNNLNSNIPENKNDNLPEVNKSHEPTIRKYTLDEFLKLDFQFWRKSITRDTDDTVSYVIAGYYIQNNINDNFFTSREVFSLLYKYGILLQDVVLCEKHNLDVKNIIKGGTSKKWTKFRINDTSISLLNDIIYESYK